MRPVHSIINVPVWTSIIRVWMGYFDLDIEILIIFESELDNSDFLLNA